MAKFIIPDVHKDIFDKLDPATMRRIRKKMLEDGSKVLQKEMKKVIEEKGHVVSRDMMNSVTAGPVREDVDGSSIEVYPQGYDRRGVSNEMKAKLIINGYYHVASSRSQRKKDNFLDKKFRDKCAPRIVSVMNYSFSLLMEELNR